MGKEWKSGLDQTPGGDARLWGDHHGGSAHVYCLRIGWREYHFTRGEILLALFVGLFIGLIVAAAQTGYLKLPDRRPHLGVYEPPEPRLLGSTESTRPEAGDPDVHFVDARGHAASRPVSRSEEAAPVPAVEPTPAAEIALPDPAGAAADAEPAI